MMETKEKLVPKLRFPEFDDNWNLFLEKIKIESGNNYSLSEYSNKGILLIQGANIYPGELRIDDPIYIENNGEQGKNLIVEKNDILLGLNRPIINGELKVCLYNKDFGFLYQRAGKLIFKSNNLQNLFLYQYLRSSKFLKKLSTELVGSDQPYIKSNLFQVIRPYVPVVDEQQKIASFLSAVDQKINQLQRKKELLQAYKKGMMQQLFSQQLRFKNENGNDFPEWRKGVIKDFGYFYYGKSAPKFSLSEDAPTPCVRYGELYSTYKEVITEIKSYTNIEPKNLKFSKGGEVLVPRVGEDPLDFANCSYLPLKDVAIGEMISVYNTKENGLYITYYFNASMKRKFGKVVEGGNVSNLYFKYLEDIPVSIPSKEEQAKIATFLSALDAKIDTVSTAITQTQDFKKGLLQQMFV